MAFSFSLEATRYNRTTISPLFEKSRMPKILNGGIEVPMINLALSHFFILRAFSKAQKSAIQR